jgi:hypothetical protein
VLSSLNWSQWVAIAVAVLSAFFAVKDKLPSLKLPRILPGRTAPAAAPTADVDVDVLDLGAIKRLEDRAERRGCPKMQEAVRALEAVFFNKAAK